MTRRGWFGALVAAGAAWWMPKPTVAPIPRLDPLYSICWGEFKVLNLAGQWVTEIVLVERGEEKQSMSGTSG